MRTPRHRNSTRDREKAELATLKGLVIDLEVHLAALRLGGQSRKSSTSAWRCFSKRQARAREAVEYTNGILNNQVQSNADWIQRLWELLREKRRAEEASSLKRMADLHQKVEDNLVLNQLKQLAKAAVPQLPNVFAANGVDAKSDVQQDLWSHVQTGDYQSTLVCVRRVPFDVHSTSTAIWTALSCPGKSFAAPNNTRHDVTPVARVLERTPTECAMKFQGGIRRKHDEIMTLNYQAVAHRTVMAETRNTNAFVWQSFFQLADGCAKHRDTMWLTVEKCTSSGLESIVTLVCQSQVEMVAEVHEITNLQASIVLAIDACIDSILSSVDNILLDEVLNGGLHSTRSNGETPMHAVDI